MIATHPLLGTGIGSFRRVSPNYTPANSPSPASREFAHNIFLQIGAELGLVALSLYLFVLWQVGAQLRIIGKPAGFALFIYLVTQFTGNSLLIYSGQPILFGLLLASVRSLEKKDTNLASG